LALFYADCLPVFLFDPVKKVIALVHSGWKGTMGKIVLQAAGMMQQQYQVELNNLQAFIGPGIASCCFEIDGNCQIGYEMNFMTLTLFYCRKTIGSSGIWP
jgi:copper oxidase (laccase) domain-containing protein